MVPTIIRSTGARVEGRQETIGVEFGECEVPDEVASVVQFGSEDTNEIHDLENAAHSAVCYENILITRDRECKIRFL
jgi:hypothetical protein